MAGGFGSKAAIVNRFVARQLCAYCVEKLPYGLWSKNSRPIERILEILAEGVASFRLSRT